MRIQSALALHLETLRVLSPADADAVKGAVGSTEGDEMGGAATGRCTSSEPTSMSGPTFTIEPSCF